MPRSRFFHNPAADKAVGPGGRNGHGDNPASELVREVKPGSNKFTFDLKLESSPGADE